MKLRPKSKKKKSPTGDMPLVEHLKELRTRVIYIVIALTIGAIIGFVWYQSAPPGMMTLGEILRGPYCSIPAENRVTFGDDGECRLLATKPGEMFMLRLKVGALAGLILSSPFWLYQVWAFVTPGLHKQERRWTVLFVTIAVSLFIAGSLLAYFIIDVGLEFLITVGQEAQSAALTGQEYFSFVLALIIIFGVSFEVPLIIIMLNIVDILTYNSVKDKRRIIWVVVFIFAALLSPGGEPFSMLVLGISVGLLVELAFQFCRWNDKRRGYDTEFEDLDDEEASQLDYQPEAIGKAEPLQSQGTKNLSSGSPFDDVL